MIKYLSSTVEFVQSILQLLTRPYFKWSGISAVLPPEQPDESGSLKAFRSITAPSLNPERMEVITSAPQVRATGSLDDLPLVVLIHRPGWKGAPDLPSGLSAKTHITITRYQYCMHGW